MTICVASLIQDSADLPLATRLTLENTCIAETPSKGAQQKNLDNFSSIDFFLPFLCIPI